MSNTYKHKGKGLWNSGIQNEKKKEIKVYLNHCHRHNREYSYFKREEMKEKNKIADKQMEADILEMQEEDLDY